MANVRNGNTYYVDTSSASGTASSFLTDRPIRITGVFFKVAATGDALVVYDKAAGSNAAGSQKVLLVTDVAGRTEYTSFAETPIICPNGLWLGLTGSPVATFILSSAGGL